MHGARSLKGVILYTSLQKRCPSTHLMELLALLIEKSREVRLSIQMNRGIVSFIVSKKTKLNPVLLFSLCVW